MEAYNLRKSYSGLLGTVPFGGFTSAYFSKQKYCEVDPQFVAEFSDQLGSEWKFIGVGDKIHTASFNKNPVHPLVMDGWSDLSSVFGFDGDRLVSFVYYGDNLFCLPLDELRDPGAQLPIYHSRSLRLPYTAHFYILLTHDVFNKPYLSLFCAFENYIADFNLDHINACCDNGTVTKFAVASTVVPFKTTFIGLGWKKFCEDNGFCVGDAICFKFAVLASIDVAHVFKVEE